MATTLEERRRWMRDGCPLDEVAASAAACRSFTLWVERDSPRIGVWCNDCDDLPMHSDEIKCREIKDVDITRDVDITKITNAVAALGVYMVEHAARRGMERQDAKLAFVCQGGGLEPLAKQHRVIQWAIWCVREGNAGGWDGWVRPKGEEECGIYLDPTPTYGGQP